MRGNSVVPLARVSVLVIATVTLAMTVRAEDAPLYQRFIDRRSSAEIASPLMTAGSPWDAYRDMHRLDSGGPGGWLLKRVTLLVAENRRLEDRHCLFLPPPSTIAFPVEVPSSARLEFSLGVLRELQDRCEGARVSVSLRPDGKDEVALYDRTLNPKRNASDRTWLSASVDLGKHAGVEGEVIFRTSVAPAGDATTGGATGDAATGDAATGDAANRSGGAAGAHGIVLANPAMIRRAAAAAAPRSVLLIGVDTLRADHLSSYGYPRTTSPNIDRLAADGMRFDRAIAPAPWTLPSFTSLLTSLYPSRHGAGRGGRGGWTRVHPDAVLVSEIFYAGGYLTAGMVANDLISPKYGLEQGFERYSHPYRWHGFESVALEAPRIIDFIDKHRDVPFFLFWHIMDPHLPYRVAPEFAEGFLDPEYEGRFQNSVDFQYLVRRPGRRRYAHEGAPAIPPELTAADKQRIVDFYDAEIAETDAAVGTVFDAIDRFGLRDRLVIAFTSDHGEGLGDHGHYHHGYTLYEDQVRVPLVLRIPGGPQGKVVAHPVSTLDVAPTLLAAAGLPVPADMQGRPVSLVDTPAGSTPPPRRPVYTEYATYDSTALKAVYVSSSKYLHDPVFHTEEVFEVEVDPAELINRLGTESEFAGEARRLLDDFREMNLRGGRYHLRVKGPAGARLRGVAQAAEVFDANVALIPGDEQTGSAFDLPRKNLTIDVPIDDGSVDIVFWFRGKTLDLRLEIVDGDRTTPVRVRLGQGDVWARPGVPILRAAIPPAAGDELAAPDGVAVAALWLESTGLAAVPTTITEEERARLRELGYIR